MGKSARHLKPVRWVGPCKRDLTGFPEEVQRKIGFALYVAQLGDKHPDVKPLKGFGSAGVLEVVEDHRGNTYRAVYTLRIGEAVYVLHVFMKKSVSGAKTPRHEIELIRRRLGDAIADAESRRGKGE